MQRFIAFDVETPNRANNRMSAIGITVIENNKIARDFYSLVNPETHFDSFNTYLTGISAESVKDAPTFPVLWRTIEPLMNGGVLVAHNAPFDMRVLKSCLADYGIKWRGKVSYLCTVQMGRKLLPDISHKLDSMCEYYGISLNHHRADSDSRACAEILLRYIAAGADAETFVRSFFFT